jgi:ADP-ribose pyrophosphatase YjhB (NUDIX family)
VRHDPLPESQIVVGCLPSGRATRALCKRAIEPRKGLWTLPAGFLENGETLAAGALRETRRKPTRASRSKVCTP